MHKKLSVFGVLLLVIGILEEVIIRANKGFALWYCEHIYKRISYIWGKCFGAVPCSIVELLLYLLILYILIEFIWGILKGRMKTYLSILFFIVSVLSFLYVNNCGINYYCPGFAVRSGHTVREYDKEELKEVCGWLADKIEIYEDEIERDENMLMVVGKDWREEAVRSMKTLGEIEPLLQGDYPNPKPLLFPWILSVQQVTGVYSPFTVEANYNNAIPAYNQPFTMCHELSHLRGFMQEKEANFISYLACIGSDNPEFCYSGYLSAYIYCSNALYRVDRVAWEEIFNSLGDAVIADIRYNNQFWKKYEGKTSEIHEKVNDTYLKANGQQEGVSGYDYMVDLVVSYYLECNRSK